MLLLHDDTVRGVVLEHNIAGTVGHFLDEQVVLSDQKRKSKMVRLRGDTATWREHLVFVVTSPLRKRLVELQVCMQGLRAVSRSDATSCNLADHGAACQRPPC